jgi:hypothetical protein
MVSRACTEVPNNTEEQNKKKILQEGNFTGRKLETKGKKMKKRKERRNLQRKKGKSKR